MVYKVLGTSPAGDLPDSIEHMISDLLWTYYDSSITGISATSILWERWFSGSSGDYGLFFQDASESNVSTDQTWALKDYDHYTDIHVFARSMHDDYTHSAEKILFRFEKMIKKIIYEHKTALATKGIQVLEVVGSRNIMISSDVEDIKRKIVTVWSRYSIAS